MSALSIITPSCDPWAHPFSYIEGYAGPAMDEEARPVYVGYVLEKEKH